MPSQPLQWQCSLCWQKGVSVGTNPFPALINLCFFFFGKSQEGVVLVRRCGKKLLSLLTVGLDPPPPNQIKDGGNLSERAFCLFRQDEYSCKV